ncbi:MAG: glycyl-radical enzyme activating protein, partial [Clostridia bacterium]
MLLFNIQRFSTHDGPGIRTTVFFKGCPLKCRWCHNPESQLAKKEVFHNAERCVLCGKCVSNCPAGAIELKDGVLITDKNKCTGCGLCADECYNCAREIAGREYSINEVMDVIMRDKTFYGESGGGVTFSGGECLLYADELTELLKKSRRFGIHTAVDTCGFGEWENLEKTLPYTNLYLYDIKCMDSANH